MSKFKYLSILLSSFLFYSPVQASTYGQEDLIDPCFFRLTTPDARKIYVLGTIHVAKIEDLLPKPALDELERIAKEEKPILYTEHALTNKDVLPLISSEKANFNWNAYVMSAEYNSLLNEPILIEKGNPTNLVLADLFKIEPWLAAPILSTHTNILYYEYAGGTEYNLESEQKWKSCWTDVSYLEGPEHYNILKTAANSDRDHNFDWIKKSLKRLLLTKAIQKNLDEVNNDPVMLEVVKSEKETSAKEMTELLNAMKLRFLNRGWKVVNTATKGIPVSVLLRNEHWAKTISNTLSTMASLNSAAPLLIIVGDGHLAGTSEDKSFLSHLHKTIKAHKVERFIIDTKSWKNVFQ